jgi:hypothetical protein
MLIVMLNGVALEGLTYVIVAVTVCPAPPVPSDCINSDTAYSVVVGTLSDTLCTVVVFTASNFAWMIRRDAPPAIFTGSTVSRSVKFAAESGGTHSDIPRFEVVVPGCGIGWVEADPEPKLGICIGIVLLSFLRLYRAQVITPEIYCGGAAFARRSMIF